MAYVKAYTRQGAEFIADIQAEGATQVAAVKTEGATQTANAKEQANLAQTYAALIPNSTGIGSADVSETTIGTTTPDTSSASMTVLWSTGKAYPYDATITSYAVRFSDSATISIAVVDPATRVVLKLWTGLAVGAGVTTFTSSTFGDYVRPAGSIMGIVRTAGTGALRFVAGGTAVTSTTTSLSEGAAIAALTNSINTVAVAEVVKATSKSVARRVSQVERQLSTWGKLQTRTSGTLSISSSGNATSANTYYTYLSSEPCVITQFEFTLAGETTGFLEFVTDNGDGTVTRFMTWPVQGVAGDNTVTLGTGLLMPAGAMVGFRVISGFHASAAGPVFQSGVGQTFFSVNSTAAIGSTVAISTTSVRVAQRATITEPVYRKRAFPLRTTAPLAVEAQTFRGTTTPNGWTLGGAFSVNDGLVSSGGGAWNNVTTFDAAGGSHCSIFKRVITMDVRITDATTIIALCTQSTSSGGSNGIALTIDCVAQQLQLHVWQGAAAAGTAVTTASLPASTITAINAAQPFTLRVKFTKDGPTLTGVVTDPITLNSATVTETLSAGTEATLRLGHGRPGVMHRQGAATVSRFAAYHNVPQDVGTLIIGDSNAEGIYADSIDTWARQAAAASSRVVVAARGGDTSATALLRTRDILALRPDRVIIAIGTNDSSQATWRANMEVLINRARSVGAEVILTTFIPNDSAQATMDLLNADILDSYFGNYRYIDFGAAVSTSNARTSWNATYKKNGNHANQAGQNQMYAQALADVAELLM